MNRGLVYGLTFAWAVSGACPAAAQPARKGQGVRPSAETVLEGALANYYADGFARVRFTNYRSEKKGIERELKVWTKGARVLGIFTQSAAIRGTAFLVVPAAEKKTSPGGSTSGNQYFIYMPAFGRIRRVSGGQRADSFFGTHLSQGDVESHPASDFSIVSMHDSMLSGEAVYELRITPRFEAGYDQARVAVAERDYAVLRIEEYRGVSKTPIRVIRTRRSWMEVLNGHVVPKKLIVSEGADTGYTEVVFADRKLDAHVPDSMFTTNYLRTTAH